VYPGWGAFPRTRASTLSRWPSAAVRRSSRRSARIRLAERLRALIEAGVDAVRFNLSHGTHEDTPSGLARREIAAEVGRPIALIADLQGPKLAIGELEEPVVLRSGDEITVCARRRAPTASCRSRPR
jgi:pyruvate kinase